MKSFHKSWALAAILLAALATGQRIGRAAASNLVVLPERRYRLRRL